MDDRRAWKLVAVWVASLLLAAAPGSADEEQAIAAGKVSALAWLNLLDAGDGGKSWESAGSLFRGKVTQEKWSEVVADLRSNVGQMKSRQVSRAEFTSEVPEAPEGQYVRVTFDTSYSKMGSVKERVVVMFDEDGEYRAIGYFIE